MSKMILKYESFTAELEQVGLNLSAVFNLNVLPESITHSIPDDVIRAYESLLLVGTNGSGFWQHLNRINKTDGHPFDQMSQEMTIEMLAKHYPEAKSKVIYPGTDYVIPLQQLGHMVGWGRPSILGIDIHPVHGTWFAYRTALLVSESLPVTENEQTPQVCEQCIEKPCQQRCPANAVKDLGAFDIPVCMNHRTEENSTCADRCLARLACPVGEDYRYSAEHLAHHSRFSLASIKRFMKNNKW